MAGVVVMVLLSMIRRIVIPRYDYMIVIISFFMFPILLRVLWPASLLVVAGGGRAVSAYVKHAKFSPGLPGPGQL